MNIRTNNLFCLLTMIAVLGLMLAGRVSAQTFTILHSFTGGKDGTSPPGGLILSGNTLYGTASAGGSAGNGSVFAVNTDGIGFTNLHSFTANSGSIATNRHGGSPQAGLILSGDGLAGPQAGLILSSNTLYGTAHKGGSSGMGMAFAIKTDGTCFTNLHSFTGGKDGAIPQAGLILSGNILYGTASYGGERSGAGTVFALNTSGTGFKTLHSFDGRGGAWPETGLILSGNALYGTAFYGGVSGGDSNDGIIFKLNTDGSGFTNLYSFTTFNHASPYTNSDGARPRAELILSGSTLYGTTTRGGSSGSGTVFALKTDGTGFINLYSFAGGKDGASPQGGLILSGDTLYGTTQLGDSKGYGTVFSLSLPAP